MVYFNEFADSSFNILLYAFHQTPDWPTELRERHRLFVDIVRLAQRLGVEFAFPTRTLHLASAPSSLSPQPASHKRPPGKARPGPGEGRVPAFGHVSHEDAIQLGRAEAEAIMEGMRSEGKQPPVDFTDPERIRTGK